VVEEKFQRVANYCINMNKELDMIAHSCGLRPRPRVPARGMYAYAPGRLGAVLRSDMPEEFPIPNKVVGPVVVDWGQVLWHLLSVVKYGQEEKPWTTLSRRLTAAYEAENATSSRAAHGERRSLCLRRHHTGMADGRTLRQAARRSCQRVPPRYSG